MSDLIFLAGLLLSQAFTSSGGQVEAMPVGVLDVYGQAHVLSYEEQTPTAALGSVEAALMMHARDAARYGIVEPAYLSTPSQSQHELQVSERGSVGDVSISFSISNKQGKAVFETFEMSIAGERLNAIDYAALLTELKRGYRAQAHEQNIELPTLPVAPIVRKDMI